MLAFVPLYVLGLMGATRRLDHYDESLGWQGLFIVAAIGVLIIALGAMLQIWQIIYSFYKRRENIDTSGDPWGGRTLEWSTSSPPPLYNFASIPTADKRDIFWEWKRSGATPEHKYEDIYLPKNTGMGILIAALAALGGFALIWHIWWLAFVSLIGILFAIIVRTTDPRESEYKISVEQIKSIEARL
jgi:cytochrome o ubiquinol oxidase subunit I